MSRRWIMKGVVALALALAMVACSSDAYADARVVRRSGTPEAETARPDGPSRWSLDIGGGIAAGGDLFQVIDDQTRTWTSGLGGTFQAERFDVTLDEDLMLQIGLAYRIASTGTLRLCLQWTEMDLTALANDSQFVAPVPWDRLRTLRWGMLWEQKLAESRLSPYLLGGVFLTSTEANASALDHGLLATPVFGAGLSWQLGPKLGLRVEFLDGVRRIGSEGLLGDVLPTDADLRDRGPHHLVGFTAGIRLAF